MKTVVNLTELGPRLASHNTGVLEKALASLVDKSGVALEFGVGTGTTLRLIAGHMEAYGFDSFRGLPEDWRPGFPAGTFACNPPSVPGATLVIGSFADTLPQWVAASSHRVTLIHIDCDLYSSTSEVLSTLCVAPNTVIVFDEYHGYPGWEQHECRAWSEYVERTGRAFEVLGHGPEQLAVRVAYWAPQAEAMDAPADGNHKDSTQ